MKKFKPGLRNIKTTICILICIAFSYIVDSKEAIFFCGVASVLCMKQSHSESVKCGLFLFLGTIYGGLLGLFSLWISDFIPQKYSQLELLVIMVAVFLGIYGCNLFRANGSISITCIILLKVCSAFYDTNKSYPEIIYYLISVVLFFTFIGIVFAIIINKFVYPHEMNNANNEQDEKTDSESSKISTSSVKRVLHTVPIRTDAE